MNRTTQILLNLAHALDHLFLLIFAAAVGAIAKDFGLARWEDMMPYTTGAFVLFGLGSVPSGRLGDLWGRRRMMLVFFFGMGLSALAVACTRTPTEMAIALVVMGAFSSIYHPVGIPMLVQSAARPGWTIGVNGLAGNLGIATAALSTGFLVEHFGWRVAFVVPALVCMGLGLLFSWHAPAESATPARSRAASVTMPKSLVLRTFLVMVITATTTSLLFNFTTNGNAQLLADRLQGQRTFHIGHVAGGGLCHWIAGATGGRALTRPGGGQAFVCGHFDFAVPGFCRGLTNQWLAVVSGRHRLYGDGVCRHTV
jgi:MFS family permease